MRDTRVALAPSCWVNTTLTTTSVENCVQWIQLRIINVNKVKIVSKYKGGYINIGAIVLK